MKPPKIEPSWDKILIEEWEKPYISSLASFIAQERDALATSIYPSKELVFNALRMTPYPKVKVVIIGQDPYHGPGQAHGLCFSVIQGVPPPPSLQNIFKELAADIGCPIPTHGCLVPWAEQGVLLLNAILTVRQGKPLSHRNQGWEQFTDAIVHYLCLREDPVIFVLWGRAAQEKFNRVIASGNGPRHLVLTAAHPSPLSAYNGFFGCKHFSKINEALLKWGKEPISWTL